jgi:hypothetical protein
MAEVSEYGADEEGIGQLAQLRLDRPPRRQLRVLAVSKRSEPCVDKGV